MDFLSDLLEGLRFRGRLYCKVIAREPWGLSATPSGNATFHGVLRGRGILTTGGKRVELAAGDVVVLAHGTAHSIASGTTTLEPIASALAGKRLVRVGGSGRIAELVCGCFFTDARDLPPLFSFLPPVLHAHDAGLLLRLLASEAERDAGAAAASARLTEALFVHAIRSWAETSTTWLAAMRDPAIGTVLGQLHRAPERDWTVRSLARVAGVSRSGFAARFAATVGETPIDYLTRWRIYLATRQLRETTRAVAEVAASVGYGSEAALNKAFKRLMGMPPGAYRRRA